MEKSNVEFSTETIDIRDYCNNFNQPLCITDGDGIVLYANDFYRQELHLSSTHIIGKPEPFPNPISKVVKARKAPVTFGNSGARLKLKNAHMVSGVPLFKENGEIKYIVIMLDTDDVVYQRYQELKTLMNNSHDIQISNDASSFNSSNTLLGNHPCMYEVQQLILKVAPTDATALIMGESGSGKEVVADNIFFHSNRKAAPFVKINCSAIPNNLLEAELFGYEKGSFTGANKSKQGLLEIANNGTILLDEIGDMSLDMQPKLLRVLQQKEIYRIGSNVPIKVDVRVIAATNVDLRQKIREGLFREDLYYRINAFPIRIPALRERGNDILILANYFLSQYCTRYGKTLSFSKEICELFLSYHWPGNVRELQNIVEYYTICSEIGSELTAEQIAYLFHSNCSTICATKTNNLESHPIEIPFNKEISAIQTLQQKVNEFEKQVIIHALNSNLNIKECAKDLGLNQSTLYRKIKKLNITL